MSNWGPTVMVLSGVAAALVIQASRITDLKDSMNKRFDDLKDSMNKRFDDLRDLLKSEVKRLEERIAHTRV